MDASMTTLDGGSNGSIDLPTSLPMSTSLGFKVSITTVDRMNRQTRLARMTRVPILGNW